MEPVQRMLLIAGFMLIAIALLWKAVPLGKLPGDIILHNGSTTIFIPITTSILISILLSAAYFIYAHFR